MQIIKVFMLRVCWKYEGRAGPWFTSESEHCKTIWGEQFVPKAEKNIAQIFCNV